MLRGGKWGLIFFSAGLFSGNVPVVPTILIEITDKTNQAFAFSFFGVWWPVGAVIGYVLAFMRLENGLD